MGKIRCKEHCKRIKITAIALGTWLAMSYVVISEPKNYHNYHGF